MEKERRYRRACEREREIEREREEGASIHAIHKNVQATNNEKARYARAHAEKGKINERGNRLQFYKEIIIRG